MATSATSTRPSRRRKVSEYGVVDAVYAVKREIEKTNILLQILIDKIVVKEAKENG